MLWGYEVYVSLHEIWSQSTCWFPRKRVFTHGRRRLDNDKVNDENLCHKKWLCYAASQTLVKNVNFKRKIIESYAQKSRLNTVTETDFCNAFLGFHFMLAEITHCALFTPDSPPLTCPQTGAFQSFHDCQAWRQQTLAVYYGWNCESNSRLNIRDICSNFYILWWIICAVDGLVHRILIVSLSSLWWRSC